MEWQLIHISFSLLCDKIHTMCSPYSIVHIAAMSPRDEPKIKSSISICNQWHLIKLSFAYFTWFYYHRNVFLFSPAQLLFCAQSNSSNTSIIFANINSIAVCCWRCFSPSLLRLGLENRYYIRLGVRIQIIYKLTKATCESNLFYRMHVIPDNILLTIQTQ